MLRILDSRQLDGFVVKSPGGPPFELLSGTIADICSRPKGGFNVRIRGSYVSGTGTKIMSASLAFIDRGSDRKLLATRLIAAKAQKGKFISALVMIHDNERIVLDFKYSGLWNLKGYLGEKNVLIGKGYDFTISCQQRDIASAIFPDYNRSGQCFRRKVYFADECLKMAISAFQSETHSMICICGPGEGDCYHCNELAIIA